MIYSLLYLPIFPEKELDWIMLCSEL